MVRGNLAVCCKPHCFVEFSDELWLQKGGSAQTRTASYPPLVAFCKESSFLA